MRRTERGFTLVEMIMSVIICGIILAGITQATITGLRTIDNTNRRLAGANDTQLIAAYLNTDVASAESVSVTGTTSHSAPSVTATTNARLVDFWSLKALTTLTTPAGMTLGWSDTHSPNLTLGMFDQSISAAGATGNRLSESTVGTSSITHSLALSPAALQTVARRGVGTPGATTNGTALVLTKPDATQNGDVLLAQVAVSGGSATSLVPPTTVGGWALRGTLTSGTSLVSAIYSHTAASTDGTTGFAWSWTGNQEAVGQIVGYSGVGTLGNAANDLNPCGGETPALLLRWTDQSVAHEITYNVITSGDENRLVRRHCTAGTGANYDEHVLARSIAPGPTGASAACMPAACGPTRPITVVLTLTEPIGRYDSVGRSYQLSGSTRASG